MVLLFLFLRLFRNIGCLCDLFCYLLRKCELNDKESKKESKDTLKKTAK